MMRTCNIYFAMVLVIFLTAVFFAGCGSNSPGTGTTTPSTTGPTTQPTGTTASTGAPGTPGKPGTVSIKAEDVKPDDCKADKLWEAVDKGNAARVKGILEKEPKLVELSDSNKNTPLHLAVMANRVDVVQVLVEAGAKTNEQNVVGNTPLHSAISGPAAKLLVQHGADVTIKNKEGQTALEIAKKNTRGDVEAAIKSKKS